MKCCNGKLNTRLIHMRGSGYIGSCSLYRCHGAQFTPWWIRGSSIFVGVLLEPDFALDLEHIWVRIWSRFAEGNDSDFVLFWLVLVHIFLTKP